MNQTIIDTIVAMEERLRQAMLSSNTAELDKLLSSDLIFTNHFGIVVSKQDDINLHASGDLDIKELQLSDQKIKLVNDAAVVTTQADIIGSYQGMPANGSFRFTRVWSRTTELHWQVVVGHACLIA